MTPNPTESDDSAQLEKAMAEVDAAIPRAEKDDTRHVYHFCPPAQWINDPVGVTFHNGFYHVFYDFNPYTDTWGEDGAGSHAQPRSCPLGTSSDRFRSVHGFGRKALQFRLSCVQR